MATIKAVAPTSVKELVEAANNNFTEAKAILGDQHRRNEEGDKVETLIADAKEMQARAAQLQDVEASMGKATEMMAASTKGGDYEESQEADDIDRETKLRKMRGYRDEKLWHSMGEFYCAVNDVGRSRNLKAADPRLQYVRYDDEGVIGERQEKTTLIGGQGSLGGFLIPIQQETGLLSVEAQQSDIRSRATIIQIRRRSVQIPVVDQTNTTADQPAWFGGMLAFWAAEGAAKTETNPEFRSIILQAHKLIAFTRASDELLDDEAVGLTAFLSGQMGFSGVANWYWDNAFLKGDGVGKPLGVINSNAGVTIAEGRNTANTVTFDDFADMLGDFLPGDGAWWITPDLMSDVIQMSGPTGNASFIWQANAVDGIPGQILGKPVIWDEKMEAAGTRGDVLLANWKFYLIGERQATTIESTQFESFLSDLTTWRMVSRGDGQPWLTAPITLADGSKQLSPFVVLSSAAGGS